MAVPVSAKCPLIQPMQVSAWNPMAATGSDGAPPSGRWLPIAVWVALFASFFSFISQLASPVMAATVSPGPSFDCAKPSEIEAVICSDPSLSASDRRMMAFYNIARAGALGTGSNQMSVQRDWLKERDKSCARGAWKAGSKSLRDCVAAEYDERLEALAIANLMTEPNESLKELSRLRPKALPLYRAVYDYASIDDRNHRTGVVEADLAPIYVTMDANTRQHLQSPPDFSATTAHEAASSDENFAAFFAIYATIGYDDDGHDLTWPCAALAKRPGLVVGLGAYFGGAIDGHIPGSDCEAAMPPTRDVTALSDAAYAVQPPCQGTIRFSTGRAYAELQDAVRLHRTEVWETKTDAATANGGGAPDPTERVWRRKHKAQIDRAEAVLEGYYVRYFGVEPKAANRDARNAIDSLVDGPFQSCE